MLPTTTSSTTPLALTTDDLSALDKARGWARFVGIVYLLGCVLFGLAMLAATTLSPVPGSMRAMMGIVGLMGVGMMVVFTILLMRYTSGIAAHAAGDSTALARAFWSLKVLWIITVVVYVLSMVTTVVMTVLQLLGIAPGQPG